MNEFPTDRQEWNQIFQEQFEGESDRAGAIIASSILDHSLEVLLKSLFVSITTSQDELFDVPYAPLSSFSAKIGIAHRMGIIPVSFTRALHMVRKIRNDFAHDVSGCSFDDANVRSRVVELAKSIGLSNFAKGGRDLFPKGTKGDFQICASWMIWFIWGLTEKAVPFSARQDFSWISRLPED